MFKIIRHKSEERGQSTIFTNKIVINNEMGDLWKKDKRIFLPRVSLLYTSILTCDFTPHFDYEYLVTFLLFPSDDCANQMKNKLTEF